LVCLFLLFFIPLVARVFILILVAVISLFPAVLLYYRYHPPQILFNLTALHSFTPFSPLSLLCTFHIQPTLSSFHIHLCITLVVREQLAVTQRASPLTPSFLLTYLVAPFLSSLSYIVPRPI
jgi:hypothetical protein